LRSQERLPGGEEDIMGQVRTRRRAVVLTVAGMLGLLLTGVGSAPPAAAAVTGVIGNAYGYRLDVTLFGGPVNTRGPAPTATLPPGGSATAVTGNAATGSAVVGPATFFSTGPITVSTQGTPAGGSVTTTTNITTINTSQSENFSATNASSTCTATEAGTSGSATITGGVLYIDSGDDLNFDDDYTDPGEHPPVTVPVPTNPAPNTTFQGHIHVNGVVETFTYVFNEQVVNPDGSLTVNAGHEYLHGPTAVGELTWGHAVCGVQSTASTYAPVSPFRVWDSRVGPGPVGAIGPGQVRNVTVAGVPGSGVPASGVTAVVLNVTATGPTADTYITAWPAGEAQPNASNLNVPPGATRPNLVTVKVGAGGQVSFFNATGNVHLIADVAGWYGPAAGQRYTATSPFRVWDSRVGPGPQGTIGPGQTRNVTVTGVPGSGVPASGVTAVVLNVTATGPTADTFVTAWPAGEQQPNASNLNVPPGDTRPNLVIVKVGAGGQVSFANFAGNVHLIADVAGWYGAPGG
jgi:hypothetical protein